MTNILSFRSRVGDTTSLPPYHFPPFLNKMHDRMIPTITYTETDLEPREHPKHSKVSQGGVFKSYRRYKLMQIAWLKHASRGRRKRVVHTISSFKDLCTLAPQSPQRLQRHKSSF